MTIPLPFVQATGAPLLFQSESAVASNWDWLLPSIALTIATALFAFISMPDYSGMIPALLMLPVWMVVAAILGGVYGLGTMVSAKVGSPFAHIWTFIVQKRTSLWLLIFCVFLAGLNMIAFMWIKPLLNYMIPFWADPILADIDNFMFAGNDPWTLIAWLNSTPAAIFYHRGWFALMILTLLIGTMAAPSAEKSAAMLTYFMLWSVAGPLIHTLLPAAGPVFYAQMGYGDRFIGLEGVPETMAVANYLWTVYSGSGFGPGSGISAMPSMHIATTVWMLIVFRLFAHRWLVTMAGAGSLIFLLSISLGWHYAIDGIIGGFAAVACYWFLLRCFRRKRLLLPRPSSRACALAQGAMVHDSSMVGPCRFGDQRSALSTTFSTTE